MKNSLLKIVIRETTTLSEALKRMNQAGVNLVLVCSSSGKLRGVISHGDIRRIIHQGVILDKKLGEFYNREPLVATSSWDLPKIKRLALSRKKVVGGLVSIPIIDKSGKVVDLAVVNNLGEIGMFTKGSQNLKQTVERILVTGGAGYLGSVLVRKLLERGYKVKVLDNLTFGKESLTEILAHRNFDLLVGNILHIDDVVEAIRDVDAVVHLAAIVGDEASRTEPIKTINNNILATVNLANAYKKFLIGRLIFASSCSVYGAGSSIRLLTEKSKLVPTSLYAYSKIESEIELLKMKDEGFSPTILRFATLFGHSYRMRFDLVVNLFTLRAFLKKKVDVFGGNQWRPFLHTTDAAEAIIRVLEVPVFEVAGEVFNVGSEDLNKKITEAARLVQKIDPKTEIEENRKVSDLRNYRVAFGKIKKKLGFETRVNLEDGIHEMLRHLRKNTYNLASKNLTNFPVSASLFSE